MIVISVDIKKKPGLWLASLPGFSPFSGSMLDSIINRVSKVFN
jgi:hypothetical protein